LARQFTPACPAARGLPGPVSGDKLPAGKARDSILPQAGLERMQLLDREDLFFLEAVLASRHRPAE